MTNPIFRIFISSTWIDLLPEREMLLHTLQRMDDIRFVGMEFFGSRPEDTREASLQQVDSCHIYVGIFAARYGSGITEAEYLRANERGLPCYIFIKREDATQLQNEQDTDQKKLKSLKQSLRRSHTVVEFSTPAELALRVSAALHNWIVDRILDLNHGTSLRF